MTSNVIFAIIGVIAGIVMLLAFLGDILVRFIPSRKNISEKQGKHNRQEEDLTP